MRIFYIFKIKKEVFNIYEKTPSVLFNILKNIYNIKENKEDYCLKYINIITTFNKEQLDKKIYIKMHNEMRYIKRKDEHIINNLYKNEVSIMKIKKNIYNNKL